MIVQTCVPLQHDLLHVPLIIPFGMELLTCECLNLAWIMLYL